MKRFDIQGHRGARGLFPENTLTAFLEAVKLGVNTLELDVVISKDHQVVVSHEPWMNPVFCSTPEGKAVEDERYNLYEMDYATIKTFDCGKRKNPEFPLQKTLSEYKPLLSEVISQIDAYTKEHGLSSASYNIELKSESHTDHQYHPEPPVFSRLVYDLVKHLLPRIILQSFDVRILQELHRIDPSIRMSLLVENKDSLQTHLNNLGFKPAIYGPEFILIDASLINELQRLDIKLIPWTVNEPHDMKRLIDMGVDGIITDYPDRLINLIKTHYS
ncbi:MAG: glycerophosphodiester phosphodiesterase [Bacteroidetes bacterium]|nr:glycerophosphodiester phosphodiesterase [Bacteroidota bacterium]